MQIYLTHGHVAHGNLIFYRKASGYILGLGLVLLQCLLWNLEIRPDRYVERSTLFPAT